MSGYEYKVVPAPMRGLKAKGVKGTPARFANALQTVMNEHGAQGWEYQRTDTLPAEERVGLTGKTTTYQNMLVFRRALIPLVDHTPEAPAGLIEDQTEVEPAQPDVAHSPEVSATDDAPQMDETDKTTEGDDTDLGTLDRLKMPQRD